jgi:hypothetical protein
VFYFPNFPLLFVKHRKTRGFGLTASLIRSLVTNSLIDLSPRNENETAISLGGIIYYNLIANNQVVGAIPGMIWITLLQSIFFKRVQVFQYFNSRIHNSVPGHVSDS